jgi:hypothetical protein
MAAQNMQVLDGKVKVDTCHGPEKDGLAAFLVCQRERFKLGEAITVIYAVTYLGPGKYITIQPPYPAWEPDLVSWFSITGPDGKDIPYTGPKPRPSPLKAENALQLGKGQSHGIQFPDIGWGHKLATPGTYTIKWNYRIAAEGSWWQGHLVSNEIQIEIVK